jgi:hypothetical protein
MSTKAGAYPVTDADSSNTPSFGHHLLLVQWNMGEMGLALSWGEY